MIPQQLLHGSGSRRSRRFKASLAACAIVLVLNGHSGEALVSSASIRTSRILRENPLASSSVLVAQKNQLALLDTTNDAHSSLQHHKRISHHEQQELLRKTVEMKRINNIKSELMLQSGGGSLMTIALSKAAGYGDELDLLENAVSEGEKARNEIVTGNMGLVYFCVNDIMSKRRNRNQLQSLSKEDLVQEGAIGLARAVDRWNPEIGGKFSTYAVYWIRAAVLRGIAERDDFVRVPEHVSAAVRKVTRAAQSLGLNIDENDGTMLSPQWKEAKAAKALAEKAGLTDRQLVEAMKVRDRRKSGILSFETWMQTKQHSNNDLVTPAVVDTAVEDDYSLSSADSAHLKQELAKFLRPKEIEAISWRYGLNVEQRSNTIPTRRNYLREVEQELFHDCIPVRGKWGEAMSFSEVGNKMQVSAEYGRRLCHAALKKLREAAEEGALEPAFLF